MSDKPVGSYGLDAHGNTILEEFRENRPVFAKMLSIVRDTLRKSIQDNHIYINAVEARIKEESSLAGKLDRKGEKYKSLDDITDILGVRVITFYSDEVDKIAALAEQLFEVDWVNSIDKRKMHELHSFGYNSLHYICRLPEKIYKDPECPQLNQFRFELQMRSALQHVWATLDHDTGYKTGVEVPREYLRNLNRLAGMLELVDEQFCQIRTGINNYRRRVQALVHSGNFEEVSLDGDSFSNYLQLRPFDALNKRIASINQAEIHETSLSRFLSVFVSFGFKTLGDIDRLIKRDSDDAYQLAAFQLANTDLDIINSSLGVISLCSVHVLKQGGGVLELTRFLEMLNGVSANNKHRAEGLFRVAQNLSFMKK
jgi:ppGpp synthetase/RelA/SpoT-type nucleotidyltranferase